MHESGARTGNRPAGVNSVARPLVLVERIARIARQMQSEPLVLRTPTSCSPVSCQIHVNSRYILERRNQHNFANKN